MSNNGVPEVKVFPPEMTGRKYRKQLGIKLKRRCYSHKSFVIKHKFACIKSQNRLGFLCKMANVKRENSLHAGPKGMRKAFNSMKLQSFPMQSKAPCYVCKHPADVRHHVITLKNGGRNKANNIVPLCYSCHTKVHPHLQEANKKKVASRHSVFPKINGPLTSQESKKIIFVPTKRVTADVASSCVKPASLSNEGCVSLADAPPKCNLPLTEPTRG